MKVSVLIAAHNEGKSLSRTIASALYALQGIDAELIVADDAIHRWLPTTGEG